MSYDSSLLKRFLSDYYKTIFPFKSFTKWLMYDQKPSEYFSRREFAFILAGDVHLRYRSFADAAEFEKELCSVNPEKLDLGAVYSCQPKERMKHSDFKAVERELVFDIDLTDYDNVRTCCSDAKVCTKCWRFVSVAVKVLDKILIEHFGFKSRLWVFSGRRGVHCWIGDKKARKLNNVGRSAVAEYLSLIVGDKLALRHASKASGTYIKEIHPVVRDSYEAVMASGEIAHMIEEQGWLTDDKYKETFLPKIIDPVLRCEIENYLDGATRSAVRWGVLKRYFDDNERKKIRDAGEKLPKTTPQGEDKDALMWFVLWHSFPRLDVNVSTGTNHLLKSPFCIHPKTGNVAVPLNVETISEFDVTSCPRIDVLVTELNRATKEDDVKENRKVLGYKHTSLAPYVENFERFVECAVKS